MKKRWWNNWIVIISFIAALFTIGNSFYGWIAPEEEVVKPGFICPDGTVVSVPEDCTICNENRVCDQKEDCTCEDCEDVVKCVIERVGEDETLLILNEPKRIDGKRVTVKEITTKGVVSIEVDGELKEIETTKKEVEIRGLKVTTQEIIYNFAKPKASMVIVKIESN